MTRTILISDQSPSYRKFLHVLLTTQFSECEVLEAHGVESAMHVLRHRSDVNLLIVNDGSERESFLRQIKTIRHTWPGVVVMMMSDSPEPHDLQDILSYGVHGFMIKTTRAPVIASAISLVLAGEIYLPREYVQHLLQHQPVPARHEKPGFSAMELLADHLTPRQCEVLRLLVEGHRNKEICNKLNMSMGTIKTHCNAIFRFLNVNNRTQAAQAARRMQLI